jgi:hypothetical protein
MLNLTLLGALGACVVSHTETVTIFAPLASVYDYVARETTPAHDLARVGLVPGVSGDHILTPGGWDHVGATRLVYLEDGSSLVEAIEALDPPSHFAYRVSDFGWPLSALVQKGHGSWEFTADPDGGTHVAWTYAFTPPTCLTEPALALFVATQFQPYMAHGLAAIAADVVRNAF